MRALLTGCLVFFASCVRPNDGLINQPAEVVAPTVVSETALGVNATGVTIDKDGKRFVWVSNVGLHEVTPNGLQLTFGAQFLGATELQDFQDVVIVDDNRIALVAQNEGSVVSRQTGQLLNRFCYLPGGFAEQDRSAWQLSRALGYDAAEDRLYVQPQTFTGFGATLTSSQLGVFDPKISEPLEWQTFSDINFIAGGMAITSRQGTYLGVGSRLYRYNALTQKFDKWWDLISQVTSIEGLAYDRTANTMVVLDGANQKLVELRFDGKQ